MAETGVQEILPGKKKKSNIFNLTDRETGRKISEENMANYVNEFFSNIGADLAEKMLRQKTNTLNWRYDVEDVLFHGS